MSCSRKDCCRRGVATLGIALVLLLAPAPASAAGEPVRIGVVFDGEAAVTTELFEQIQREILTLTEGEFDVRFEDRDVVAGDWTVEGVNAAIETLLKDPEIDLVIALGVVASHTFCCRETLSKPVIAGFVVDGELQNLPREGAASGVHNLNYLTFPSTFERDVDLFSEIVPFQRLTALFNRWFAKVVPELSEQIRRQAEARGIAIEIVTVGESVDEAMAAIPRDTDAVYLAPLLHLPDSERLRLIEGLNERYLPSFSIFGTREVADGVLAGQRDDAFYDRLSRRIAINVQRILLGEDAGAIPVDVPDRQRLTINMETARNIGAFPPWHLLTEAELLHEDPPYQRVLTIRQAVEEAIEANLDLAAKEREVAAGEQQVALARSLLRPAVEVGATGVLIDATRASSPFSAQAERTWGGSLTLTQLIYSEPALANVAISGHAQLGREQELEQLRLDVAAEAMVTYMNVLLSRTVEKIRTANLEVSRSNLELARVRRAVGDAGPGEVYRWESAVATARRDLVDARSDTYQAKIALNRLLHRRAEEGFRTRDITLELVMATPLRLRQEGDAPPPAAAGAGESSEPPLLTRSRDAVLPYIGTPLHFEVFRQFMVEEGLARAPELRQLDAAIAAQRRALQSARRSFWSPEVVLQGQLDEVIERGGEGASRLDGAEDTTWSVGVLATLPLTTGGARRADEIAGEESLARLELQREALAERLEQLIRSSLYVTNASFSGIQLTRQAADAAGKNLELVTDSYSQGVVDVLDLIDAQNAALSADLAAASALYQFFIDLIRVERAVNWLEFMRTPQEQAAWFSRLAAFFRDNGLEPRAVVPFPQREEP